MKKQKSWISVLLLLSMLCAVLPSACADKGTFDYEANLGSLDGYAYNEEEDCWTFSTDFSYGKIHFIVSAQGVSGGSALDHVELSVFLSEDATDDLMKSLYGAGLLVDGVYYRYTSMDRENDVHFVFVGEEGQALLKAIAESDPKGLSVIWMLDLFSIEMTLTEEEAEPLREFCRIYVENDLWAGCQNKAEAESCEKRNPLSIEKKSD